MKNKQKNIKDIDLYVINKKQVDIAFIDHK